MRFDDQDRRCHELFAARATAIDQVQAIGGDDLTSSAGTLMMNVLNAVAEFERLVLLSTRYFQPITRAELGEVFVKEISRDTIGHLRKLGFIAAGPRSPQTGAPYTYVTTREFLAEFGFETLRDLPDFKRLEDAGLLSKDRLLAGELMQSFSRDEGAEGDRDDERGRLRSTANEPASEVGQGAGMAHCRRSECPHSGC